MGMQSLGGLARAAKLTPERRKEIATLGGNARWNHDPATEAKKALTKVLGLLAQCGPSGQYHVKRIQSIIEWLDTIRCQ